MNSGAHPLRKAVFLDRDGVLNRALVRDGKPYPPARLEEMMLLPRVREALDLLKDAGFLTIVVTNQPDIARGTTTLDSVTAIHDALQAALPLDEIRCCIHDDREDCACRKPKPSALLAAARDHGLDLSRSYMVGDRWRDIDAGHAAGVTTILIDYAYGEQAPASLPDFLCPALFDAVLWILSRDHSEKDKP